MSLTVKKCGIKLNPPALILLYSKDGKLRRRLMPIRGFTKSSIISNTLKSLKEGSKHKEYVSLIPDRQLEKLLTVIKDKLGGSSLEAALAKQFALESIDPNEDLNKLDDETLRRKKAVMDQTFEKNRKKPGDDGYEYEVDVEYEPEIETNEWDDSGSDSEY